MEERPRDKCLCGRTKDKADYCCETCYSKQHKNIGRVEAAVYREDGVRVVLCPDNEFRPGSTFPAAEFGLAKGRSSYCFRQGLTDGVYPPGMVVEFRGHLYQVEGKEGEPQRMAELCV